MRRDPQLQHLFESAQKLHQSGALALAQKQYEQLLQRDAQDAEACFALGLVLLDQERFADSLQVFQHLVEQEQQFPDLWLAMGDALLGLNDIEGAREMYRKAVAIEPGNIDGLIAQAQTAFLLKDFHEACRLFQQAAQLIPDDPTLQYNCGLCCAELHQWEQAEAHYQKALSLNPSDVNCILSLSSIYSMQGRHSDVVTLLKPAATRYPDSSSLHFNLGQAYEALGERHHAAECYQSFLAIEPNHAAVHNSLGIFLKEDFRNEEAAQHFAHALAIDPGCEAAYQNLFQTWRDLCDWTDYNQRLQQYLAFCRRKLAQDEMPPVAPFFALSLPFTEEEILKIGKLYGAKYAVPSSERLHPKIPSGSRPKRLRIGYVSANFHDHPGNHLICGLFALHDRERFEVTLYSFGGDSDSPYRKRVVEGADRFVDITPLSDRESAERILEDEIDILVDLKGFTRPHRPTIFAYTPAPVQVGYLGYAGSTGLPSHQFILADRVVVPPESATHYSEEVIYLPHQYQVNDHLCEISQKAVSRQEEGLPEEAFVFCCFNQNYKIEPDIFALWMRILQRVPGSVLWLLRYSRTVQSRLRAEAEKQGIAADRLIFSNRVARPEHLARQVLADLFLDTFHYNAHTTATDALRMGVPLLTCAGNTFASRVAKSLLHAVGLPELAVDSFAAYEELAVSLANDPDRCHVLRTKLKEKAPKSPLLNTPCFARDIEAAFETMWERVATSARLA